MSETSDKSNWDELAEVLGTEPASSVDRPKQQSPPVAETVRVKVSDEARPARKADWDSLAGQLGLASAPESAKVELEVPAAPPSITESKREGETKKCDTSAPPAVEGDDRPPWNATDELPQSLFGELEDAPVSPARPTERADSDPSSDPDQSFDGKEDRPDRTEADRSGAKPHGRSRRRDRSRAGEESSRRGRSDKQDEPVTRDEVAEALPDEPHSALPWETATDLGDPIEFDADGDEPGETSPDEQEAKATQEDGKSDDVTEEAEARPKRRRGRRRRGRSAGRQREDADESQPSPSDARDDDDVDDSDDTPSRRASRTSHKNIPSWQEAISAIVDGNLANRSSRRRPARGRGRRGGRKSS